MPATQNTVTDANGNALHVGDLVALDPRVPASRATRIEHIGDELNPRGVKVGRGWESGRSLYRIAKG